MRPVLSLMGLFFAMNIYAMNIFAGTDKAQIERLDKINKADSISKQLDLSGLNIDEQEFLLGIAKKSGLKIFPQAQVSENVLIFQGSNSVSYKLVAVDPITGRYSLNDYAYTLNAKHTRPERIEYFERVIRKISNSKSAALNFSLLPRAEAADDLWMLQNAVTLSFWQGTWFGENSFQDVLSDMNETTRKNHRIRLKCEGKRGGILEVVTRSGTTGKATHTIRMIDPNGSTNCSELGQEHCARLKRIQDNVAAEDVAIILTTRTDEYSYSLQQQRTFSVNQKEGKKVPRETGTFSKCSNGESSCVEVKSNKLVDIPIGLRSEHDAISGSKQLELLIHPMRECCKSEDQSCVDEINNDENFGLNKVSTGASPRKTGQAR